MMLSAKFKHFILFQTEQHLFRKRWWLLPPIVLFITYITVSSVLIQAINNSVAANCWDALFSIFGNGNILFFVLTPLFLYLVSDMASESRFGEVILLRLGSRRLWWLGKVFTLVLMAIFYIAIIVGMILATISFVLPWERTWSNSATQFPFDSQLIPEVLSLSPTSAFSQLLLLLLLGWFCLGLLIMVVTQSTGRPILGFTIGILTNFLSLLLWRDSVVSAYEFLFMHQHLLFYSHTFTSRSPLSSSVLASVVYWTVCIVLLFGLGWRLSQKYDFLGREE